MKKGQKAVPGISSAESTGTRRSLANQPTTKHNVPGVEDPSRTGGSGPKPSSSRTVKGMPSKLK